MSSYDSSNSKTFISLIFFSHNDSLPIMMPLEIQLQTDSPSGAVMICTVGKLLIWKQRVRGVMKCGTTAELLSPGWLLLNI